MKIKTNVKAGGVGSDDTGNPGAINGNIHVGG
jgi:hypothetical protein